jgi:hypothetical protein
VDLPTVGRLGALLVLGSAFVPFIVRAQSRGQDLLAYLLWIACTTTVIVAFPHAMEIEAMPLPLALAVGAGFGAVSGAIYWVKDRFAPR